MSSKTESAYLKKLSTKFFFKKVDKEHLAYAKYLLTITTHLGDHSDIRD